MLDDARVDRRAVVDDARRHARAASREARERRADDARETREKARVGVGAEDMARGVRGVAQCGVGRIGWRNNSSRDTATSASARTRR